MTVAGFRNIIGERHSDQTPDSATQNARSWASTPGTLPPTSVGSELLPEGEVFQSERPAGGEDGAEEPGQ